MHHGKGRLGQGVFEQGRATLLKNRAENLGDQGGMWGKQRDLHQHSQALPATVTFPEESMMPTCSWGTQTVPKGLADAGLNSLCSPNCTAESI